MIIQIKKIYCCEGVPINVPKDEVSDTTGDAIKNYSRYTNKKPANS